MVYKIDRVLVKSTTEEENNTILRNSGWKEEEIYKIKMEFSDREFQSQIEWLVENYGPCVLEGTRNIISSDSRWFGFIRIKTIPGVYIFFKDHVIAIHFKLRWIGI